MNYGKNILNSYDEGISYEYAQTNSRGLYASTTLIGKNTKPYHGLLVKANIDKVSGCPNPSNMKMLVNNVIETLKYDSNDIKLYTLTTKNEKVEGYKNLSKFTKSFIPNFEYRIGNVFISKKVTLVHKEEILYLEYLIENREEKDIKLRVEPLLTYRSLYSMKRRDELPFTKREIKNGVRVNLSIEKKESICIKTKDAKFRPESRYLENIEYKLNGKTYVEDLYIPGQFDIKVPASTTKVARIVLSTFDLPIDNIEKVNYIRLEEERLNRFLYGMKDCIKEVRELSLSTHELETRNMKSLRKSLLPAIPFKKDDICSVLRSIEGTFLIPKKSYQARELLRSISKDMEDGLIVHSILNKKLESSEEKVRASMFYVEAINVYMKYAENYDLDKIYFLPVIKDIIYSVLDEKNDDTYFFDDYLVGVNNKEGYDKLLDINVLWYNTLMIYIKMQNENDVIHDKLLRIANMTKQAIIDNFYDKKEGLFKNKIDGKIEDAKIDMIYTLSLSYKVLSYKDAKTFLTRVYNDYYTGYGMRMYRKESTLYDGYLYPEYLAHFIKAMYSTSLLAEITKKSSDNLVKDILEQVNKSCIGALPEKYVEETKEDAGSLMYLESMAEIIRIYDMLK